MLDTAGKVGTIPNHEIVRSSERSLKKSLTEILANQERRESAASVGYHETRAVVASK
jgi:hypothetical protein